MAGGAEMRLVALLVLVLLVGCAGQEVVQENIGVGSEMPVPEADVGEMVVPQTQETEDLTTSENTFDALDEAMEELE
jgi:hypothetical protein